MNNKNHTIVVFLQYKENNIIKKFYVIIIKKSTFK